MLNGNCVEIKIKPRGNVEMSLENLCEQILNAEKLTATIVNLIQSDRPVCGSNVCDKSPEPIEPTLRVSIDMASSRIGEMCQRLSLAKGIIQENLGELKLD